MKISLNWLRRYLDTDLAASELADVLTHIGLEVEGETSYEKLRGGLKGLVVGEVCTCEKHPNADKLSITTVDIGGPERLQIVCGAPNVAAGQKVIVATVGATLYPSEGEAFTIKKGKIRSETSEGMICAEDEIGLGQSHAGIMVLDAQASVGQTAAQYFGLESDTVLEIGLTPNRSDATNHLGVAFDLAAALRIQKGLGHFTAPDLSAFKAADTQTLPLRIEVLDTEACPRYSGICLENIQVKPSPDWLQHSLRAIGIEPINNVVDVTNFVLHEMGQALHAFDYDKIQGQALRIGKLPEGTAFTTLDGQARKLLAQDLCICDAQDQALCLAGVFGGANSGISETTTRVFLESAHFEAKGIRRSSMAHQLRTAAAQSFEKGTDPEATLPALQRAVLLLQELAGAQVASPVLDHYPQPKTPAQVRLRFAQIPRLLGLEIPKDKVLEICQVLNFKVLEQEAESLLLEIPGNKVDVLREVDVLEEILRIYGYNRVENPDMLQSVLVHEPKPRPHSLRNRLANWLAGAGYAETMGLSLIQEHWIEGLYEPEQLVFVHNTANQHLNLLRPSLLFNGLEALSHNRNRQREQARLFEWGRSFHKQEDGSYYEVEQLGLWLMGAVCEGNWLNNKPSAADYYELKGLVEDLLALCGIEADGLQSEVVEQQGPWAYAWVLRRGKEEIARMGRIQPALLRKADLKQGVFYAEIALQPLLKSLSKLQIKVKALPKFPAVRRDFALLVDSNLRFEQVTRIVNKQAKKLLKGISLFDVYQNAEQLGPDKKSYALSLVLQDESKTLQDAEVEQVMERVMQACERELEAKVRRN